MTLASFGQAPSSPPGHDLLQARSADAPPKAPSGYIVGPAYDLTLLVLSPVLAMAAGLMLFRSPLAELPIDGGTWNPRFSQPFALFFIAVFTHAHLVLVFFRSHANQKIFPLHPIRFRIVPIALLFGMLTWRWMFVAVGVVVGSFLLERQPEMRWLVLGAGIPLGLVWIGFYVRESRAGRSHVVSIMHFWYDGFVWSVRKKQV
ncbi:MAG: hypothetical protein RIT45_4199 [Pseudomonadota bacterium]|jgi:hypothetical protein